MQVVVLGIAAMLAAVSPLRAQTTGQAWGTQWQAQNKRWIAYHLIGLRPNQLDVAKRLVTDALAPLGFNVLVLEVDYDFSFQSHPELKTTGLSKEQTRELVAVCRDRGIRLIPLMNCLGHQSWRAKPGALLAQYPQFDETPGTPHDDKDIYCREWCPMHPDVNKIVFELIDELIDACDADAFHVGMDEVFLIGDKNCPRCKDKDVGDLFLKAVNDLHRHLVGERGVEMLMWSDRLLDAQATGYGTWEASATGSHSAVDRVPKDIIMCDWHYEMPATYQQMGQQKPFPSVQFFQEQGFRVLPAPWRNPESAKVFLQVAKEGATDKMLGVLFTGWAVDTEGLLNALQREPQPFTLSDKPDRDETTRGVAATIQAGLQILKTPAP
jgi:hypothetical protein